jgi:hypothetical protein
MELIVTKDEALQLVDKPAFRNLLRYVRPGLTERDIPHRTKLTETIKARALAIVDVIREHLAKVDSKVSMMFNSWTLIIGDIWNLDDKPLQWELHHEQLSFEHIEGDHSGKNIARMLITSIDTYDVRAKVRSGLYYLMVKLMVCFVQVGWMTSDNASNNNMAMKEVAREINPEGVR